MNSIALGSGLPKNLAETIGGLENRLSEMESVLSKIHAILSEQKPKKDWYSVRELAHILDRTEFTVREWCRLGRVFAEKRACGRGNSNEWIVSAKELWRIQNEGLLPSPNQFHR